MAATTLDLREIPPPNRHPAVFEAFEELDPGETLQLVNDHDPKPLFYEMQAEWETFDAAGYSLEQRGPQEFVATFPKVE